MMGSYYVLLPDGQRFGPADLALLQVWVIEGRVHPNYLLEDSVTGARIEAQRLPGLRFPTGIPNVDAFRLRDSGVGDVRAAFILAGLSVVCCGPLSLIGILYAVRAKERNHPLANVALLTTVAAFIASLTLFGWLGPVLRL